MDRTIFASLGILCVLAVVIAGCTGTGNTKATPTATAAPAATTAGSAPAGTATAPSTLTVGQAQNGTLIFMHTGNSLTLKLAENPTTGYSWNLTVTPGLTVTSDAFVPTSTNTTMVGVGGNHVWQITASQAGMQTIDGIYKRPWEPVTGNETVFTMSVQVT